MIQKHNRGLASTLKQQRLSLSLTLQELAVTTGLSTSHLSRIEQGERFPSASILQKVAKPLGFEEDELLMLAGFLSGRSPATDRNSLPSGTMALDPYVVSVLVQEPVEVQRTVVGLLIILRILAKSIEKE